MLRKLSMTIATAWLLLALPAAAQDGAITYQGQLEENGAPFTGTANLQFQLYDALVDGSQVGTTVVEIDWPVENGLFQVELDFGSAVFDGSARFLEVWVNGAPLSPRQKVTATPVALLAAGTMSGAVGGNEVDASEVQLRVVDTCPAGQYMREIQQNGSVVCGTDDAGDPAWGLNGNLGTDPASDFLGTTDDQPLEIRTYNARSLRLEPSAETFGTPALPITANVIIGSHANEVLDGVRGATIAGGGVPGGDSDPELFNENPNRVTDHYGTVGGGYGNQAGDGNIDLFPGVFATAGGGMGNTASGNWSTASGGFRNTASGNNGAVSGGRNNVASGFNGAIGGGATNTAGGESSTVSGGLQNNATGQFSTVGGGVNNTGSNHASTVGGGDDNIASGDRSTVSGGNYNSASGLLSTVGGGFGNTASGQASTVAGGNGNCAGGVVSWAGGFSAKVRPGTASGELGMGCEGVATSGDANGDEGTFVWADSQFGGFVSSGSNQFLVRAAGGVGINTNAPTFTLSVDGTAGKPGGGDWSVFSDKRLKQDIQPLGHNGSVLERLLSLRGYEFEYRAHAVEARLGLPGRQIGLLAQEVQEVFPGWVDATEEGHLYVSERGTTALFIEALRELRAEFRDALARKDDTIAELQTRVARLTERSAHGAELEARLAALEALLMEGRKVAAQP